MSSRCEAEEGEAVHMYTDCTHNRFCSRGHWRGGGQEARLEYTEVSLSSELYLAPEMMYASLDLVTMIVEATQDLPSHYIKDCFSHRVNSHYIAFICKEVLLSFRG